MESGEFPDFKTIYPPTFFGYLREIGEINKALVHVPENCTIYHYTDLMGLRGILESRKLWLTDAGYLNDRSELEYGRDAVARQLEQLRAIAEKSQNTETKRFCQLMEEHKYRVNHYVFSFSTKQDALILLCRLQDK